MKLNNIERLIFLNQVTILKKLDDENPDQYNGALEILSNGYDNEYDEILNLNDEFSFRKEPIPPSVREKVFDILLMFVDLKKSYDNLSDKSGINTSSIEFGGFDGNNESDYLTYGEYLTKRSKHKSTYKDIKMYNSHFPTLDNYQEKLTKYRNVNDNLDISKDELIDITSS